MRSLGAPAYAFVYCSPASSSVCATAFARPVLARLIRVLCALMRALYVTTLLSYIALFLSPAFIGLLVIFRLTGADPQPALARTVACGMVDPMEPYYMRDPQVLAARRMAAAERAAAPLRAPPAVASVSAVAQATLAPRIAGIQSQIYGSIKVLNPLKRRQNFNVELSQLSYGTCTSFLSATHILTLESYRPANKPLHSFPSTLYP